MRRSQIVLLFLSIVIPVGLLATFRLGGVLKEPITISETTTAETIFWEWERPLDVIGINESIQKLYSSDELSALYAIHIFGHWSTSNVWGGRPVTEIRVNFTAEVKEGYVVEVYFEFRGDNYTEVNCQVEEWMLVELDNMTLADWDERPSDRLKGDLQCFIKALGVNNPKLVRLSVPIEWIEAQMQYQSHQIEGSLEITYFNGSAYKKVVFPSIVRWVADQAGNTFETARTVEFGNYTAYVSHLRDPDDYYNIWIEKNQTVKISITPWLRYCYGFFDLYIYNSDGELLANITKRLPDLPKEIIYDASGSSYLYIRVSTPDGFGYYVLSIEREA